MMGTFERDGIQFRYEVLGEGRALALCHGLGGDRQQPKELVGDLAGYRLMVWDCRGHGETGPVGPDDKFGFGPMADDLAALLDRLGVDRAIIGGISMGAGIAARFAAQWPERVEALVLVRPAWLVEPRPENLALLPRVADMLRRLGPDAGLAEFRKLPELAADSRRFAGCGRIALRAIHQAGRPGAGRPTGTIAGRLPRGRLECCRIAGDAGAGGGHRSGRGASDGVCPGMGRTPAQRAAGANPVEVGECRTTRGRVPPRPESVSELASTVARVWARSMGRVAGGLARRVVPSQTRRASPPAARFSLLTTKNYCAPASENEATMWSNLAWI